jgi:hypothetical protein
VVCMHMQILEITLAFFVLSRLYINSSVLLLLVLLGAALLA